MSRNVTHILLKGCFTYVYRGMSLRVGALPGECTSVLAPNQLNRSPGRGDYAAECSNTRKVIGERLAQIFALAQ